MTKTFININLLRNLYREYLSKSNSYKPTTLLQAVGSFPKEGRFMGLSEAVLGLTLSIATYTDWKEQRIYNKVLAPSFLFALILNTLNDGVVGLKLSLLGAILGFSLLLLPYFLGGMGAGDVKLLTVIGAFRGTEFVFESFLYGAVIGGVISLALLIRRKALLVTLKRLLLFVPFLSKPQFLSNSMQEARQEKFPYGIAIVIGTVIAFFFSLGG